MPSLLIITSVALTEIASPFTLCISVVTAFSGPFITTKSFPESTKNACEELVDSTLKSISSWLSSFITTPAPIIVKATSFVLCNSVVEWASMNKDRDVNSMDLINHMQSDIGYILKRLGLS